LALGRRTRRWWTPGTASTDRRNESERRMRGKRSQGTSVCFRNATRAQLLPASRPENRQSVFPRRDAGSSLGFRRERRRLGVPAAVAPRLWPPSTASFRRL
jgi:hypothetical protein